MNTRASRHILSALLGVWLICAGLVGHAEPTVETPWLGVGINNGSRGVLVLEVIADTPADEAGVRAGDEIIALNQAAVRQPADLKTVVARHQIADEMTVTLIRNGEVVKLRAFLGPRLNPDEILYRRLVGKRAPDFVVDVVYGVDRGVYRVLEGRVVILQFFTRVCDPCLQQQTALSRFVDLHSQDDLSIFAITREPRRALAAWAENSAPSFNVAIDPRGTAIRDYRIEHPVPALVVIDRSGRVSYAGIGGEANLERATLAARRALRRPGGLR